MTEIILQNLATIQKEGLIVLGVFLRVIPNTKNKCDHGLEIFPTEGFGVDISELEGCFGIYQFDNISHVLLIKPIRISWSQGDAYCHECEML
jgi:hypothetical protein